MRGHRALCLTDERSRAGISLKAAAPSAGAFLAARADDHVAQLARRAGVAREHFAVQHHAAADACAERDDHGALRTFGTADQHLRQRSHVRVVADAQVKARARLDRRAQVKVLPAEVVRVEHAAGLVVHRSWAAEPDAAERGPVHAGRKLCDDCGDAVADRLRAQLNARGTAHLPRDLARLAHKRALDVCSAKVNADIVHGTVLPTGKIFSRIIPAAARNCKGSAALADGFFELFQRPLFDAGDIAS